MENLKVLITASIHRRVAVLGANAPVALTSLNLSGIHASRRMHYRLGQNAIIHDRWILLKYQLLG